MEYYGNKTWNNATDNADKSIIPLHREHFQKMLPLLEQSGLNFYAYVKDDSAVLAVNEADKGKMRKVLGDLAKDLQFSKSARPYSPPQKNVIGNTTYRYIPDKKYINLDRDTALKVAEQLEKANISYSGVIYPSGKATLTVGGADLERAEIVKQSVIDMRRQFVSDKKAEQIIGNKPYRDIQNRRVLFTNVTPAQYERRKAVLDSQVEYSGLIRNGKVMFTVDEADAERFLQAMNTAIDMESAIAEMREKGFSDEQIQSVYDVLLRAAEMELDYYVIHNLDPRFTPEEFEQMTAVLERVLAETEIERLRNDSAFSEMIDLQKEFTKQAELREIYAMHDYSDEQKAVIAEIYADIPKAMFETADESYSPEELRELGDIVRNFRNYSDIEDFLNNHQKRLEISEENAEIFKALKAHKPVYLHKENSGEGYEFYNERIEYYAGFGFAILGDTDKDSDLVHQHFYTNSPEEIVVDLIQSGELARDGYVIDGVTAPAREEQSAEIVPETPDTPELTEKEQAFMNGDIVPFLAKSQLAWDEIESIGYRLYEQGYTERFAPSEISRFGNGLTDSALFELSIRMQHGEDIRKDLAVAILGKQSEFRTSKGNEFSVEYGENGITARHGNAEREITYESIGGAMLDLIKKEYDSIVHDRTVQDLQYVIPGLSAETAEQLIHAFDMSKRADWENNLQKQRQIKRSLYDVLGDDEQTEKAFASIADMKYDYKAESEKPDSLDFHFGKEENDEWFTESDLLYDFVQEHGSISFALANALIEYLDEKQHSERSISELHAGWYKKTDFEITAVIGGEDFHYEGRFDIGDGKGTGGGSLIDHIRLFNENVVKTDRYPYNTEESKESARNTLAVFVPFLEKNAELTAEEEKLLSDFKEQHPIRGIEDVVQTMTVYHGTTADFDTFRPDYLGAVWTDTTVDHAMRYAGTLETSQVMTCEAELHNPAHFTFGSRENWDISSTIREAIDSGHDSAVITFKFMAEDNDYYRFALENYPDHPAKEILASIVNASETDAHEGETIAEFAQRMAENDNVTHCYVAVFDPAQIRIVDKTPVSELQQDSENTVIFDFRSKTAELFHSIDGYSATDIESMVREFVENTFTENGIEAEIGGIIVTGSRSRGIENDSSDIDVVIEVNSELKEDALFNILHEDSFEIGGITVDINPIRAEETGTLETYLPTAESYLTEKAQTAEKIEPKEDSMDRAIRLINEYCEREFDTQGNFSNLDHVDLAYTTDEETELPIEVYADLESFRIVKEYSGTVVSEELFDSLDDMCIALDNLAFDELVALSDKEKAIVHTADKDDMDKGPVTMRMVGNFYEMYGKNAEIGAEVLGLRMLSKHGEPMVGFPDHVKDEYSKKLGEAGYTVLIEQAFELNPPGHNEEIDEQTLGLTSDSDGAAEVSAPIDEDTPLFTDDVIEELEKSERFSDFEETPFTEGEQLSLFGDLETLVSEKPKSKPKTKSEFATGPVVDGVQVYEALATEIDRGTGFENGKIRVQDFFESNNPTTKQLADFLKKEYGTGGHSGDGKITYVDYDSKGLTFSFENGEKFRHSWDNVATMVKARLDTGTYLTPEEQEKRKALADEKGEILPDRTKNVSVGDRFRNKITGNISEVVSLTGALPHITEDCTITTNKGSYTVTENIPYREILNADRYEYLGNRERAIENSAPDKGDISSDTEVSRENKTVSGKDKTPDSTRFTSLSAEDKAFMEQYPPIAQPYGSPWGKVQDCIEIANGVFEVSTAGHGGVMIRADLAEHILSDEALKVGFIVDGYHCYEEDADAVLPLRELLDKGIMDKEQYFADKYHSTFEEMGERFNKAINDSIEVFFPEYWKQYNSAQTADKTERGGHAEQSADVPPHEEKKKFPNTIAHRNFVNLQKLYPEIFSGEHSYEKHKGEGSYEDFSIERYGDTLTLMHTFEQNGDLMYDPRIDYKIDFENQTLHAVNYEMSSLAIYQEYEDGSRGQREADSFTQTWISNLGEQERYLARAVALFEFESDVHDIDIEYDENGSITEISGEDSVIEAYKAAKGIGEIADSDNFTITDEALGEGGLKAKFNANIAAIQTLKLIEAEKRPATNEEKEILSRYVGWGGLAPAFESDNKKWEKEHTVLTELLTSEEYRSALASTLDAFYTTPTVIDGIYEALQNFGFEGGNLLEPACGVGNFFGRLPDEVRKDTNLYGVEIDSISGRIAQQLYPSADITISGFEKNEFQNGSFDVVVGNVPFGELGFKDERHGTTKLHDFFFAESLDKVKEGGIIALVTSAGTLDKRNEAVREMLAQQADLIGAVRLPSTAFKQNANTEVTTDILFLQKRSEPPAELPDWVHIGETEDGLPINKYFEQNPDMVLGEVVEGNKLYGTGTMVVPFEGKDLKELLHEAVGKLSAQISDERPRNVYAQAEQGEIPIPSNLRNYSFFEHDNNIYFKTADRVCAFRFDTKNSQHNRTKAFIELRDTTRELLTAQELNKSDSEIKALQEKLNTVYDDFYKRFGLLHSKTNKRLFSEDVSYNLVLSLEKEIDRDKLVAKSDLFFRRTIIPPKPIEHVETAVEALTLSAAEKACVDFDYMSELTGMTESELKKELEGQIFKVPHTLNTYQTASEYLSGDIRAKLNQAQEAAEYDSDFNINVTALKQAMPTPLKAGDIEVKLGAAWVPPEIYQQFIYELLQTPDEFRADVKHGLWSRTKPISLEYSESVGMFHFANKRQDMSVNSTKNFGTRKMNAYEILEQFLNLKDPKIYKIVEVIDQYGEPKEKRVVDVEATRVVQKKADKIRSEFKKWVFKDTKRREMLVNRYNELFNSVRPREYDGSHLTFPMMNADIHLHEHQKNAVAHALFGGNTLFAHSVGAGKTYEMIATAMESKRLGLCTKSLFAVPNHLTEQIGSDFRKLYPSANILVATKNDFKKENRQQLFAKIATGNFDAVIIGHSQLGMIPVSKERQIALIQDQITDILRGIDELKRNEGSKFQIKSMERTRKSLQKQLDKLKKSHDDTITFEQLGVDKLFVDEAHEFKNLFTPTKLSNISGVSTSASQKAFDLFLKCRYLDEKTGGRGVVFATGTPYATPYQH